MDLATKTLFAEFQETVFARKNIGSEISDTATFVRKTIKDKEYWYTQKYIEGKATQNYFGPKSAKNDKLVETSKKERKLKQNNYKKLLEQEQRQVAMLRRGGLPSVDNRFAQILTKLSESKIIDGNGILIGSLVFQAYSGMLGVLFEKSSLKTNDIDIIQDCSIKIASRNIIDINKLLSDFQFTDVPTLSHKDLPSSFISKDGIRIDFLSPLKGKPRGIVNIPHIKNAGAIELPYLDILIDSPIRAILLAPNGGIPITVPNPAKYAIHKLITANLRPITETTKAGKDLMQADQLIKVLLAELPVELKATLRAVVKQSKKCNKYIKASAKKLSDESQEVINGCVGK